MSTPHKDDKNHEQQLPQQQHGVDADSRRQALSLKKSSKKQRRKRPRAVVHPGYTPCQEVLSSMYAGRRKILIHVEYQGTLLNGFQMQTSALPSVQEDLEVAIFRLTGQWKRVFSASRTDAGVHARDMICCFNTDSDIPADDFAVGLTNRLSSDICVFDSHETHSEFDPRASIRKKYKYLIACSSTRPSIGREQVYHHASASKAKLNVDAMIMAAKLFEGTHDFTMFAHQSRKGQDNRRTVLQSRVIDRRNDPSAPTRGLIEFQIEGSSFVYNMVRNLAGALVDIGEGKVTLENVRQLLKGESSNDIRTRGMPAAGLCLCWVKYPEGYTLANYLAE